MTREQIQAHFILHGWEPMRHKDFWYGVRAHGQMLIYVRADGTGRDGDIERANSFSGPLTDRCDCEWEAIPPVILQQCFNYIQENKL